MVCISLFSPSFFTVFSVCVFIVSDYARLPTDTLVLEPMDPVVVLPSDTKVTVAVEVVTASGVAALFSVDVPKGSSLLEALKLLKERNVGFT